jgi:hypothetical protein
MAQVALVPRQFLCRKNCRGLIGEGRRVFRAMERAPVPAVSYDLEYKGDCGNSTPISVASYAGGCGGNDWHVLQ